MVETFPQVAVGSRVRARGTIEVDRNHGEQLRTISVTELVPTTLGGIEKYLGSGLIMGIGEVSAQRIVEKFGLDTLKVLDDEPHRLREVSGLGRTRADALVAAWQEQRSIRDVMIFLQAHGASPMLAARGAHLQALRAEGDPYHLGQSVPSRDRRLGRRLSHRQPHRGLDGDHQGLAGAPPSRAPPDAARHHRAGQLLRDRRGSLGPRRAPPNR